MTDENAELFRRSDPSQVAPLRITKAVAAFPDIDDEPVFSVLLRLNRELTPLEQFAFRTALLPQIARSPDVGLTLDPGLRALRLTGATPKTVEANKDDLARYARNISANAKTVWETLRSHGEALSKIEFPQSAASTEYGTNS